MKAKVLGLIFILINTSFALGADFSIATIQSRVDMDSLAQLNEMAFQAFPFQIQFAGQTPQDGIRYLDENSLVQEFEKQKRNSNFQESYKKLRANVEMFLISKGIILTKIPNQIQIPLRFDNTKTQPQPDQAMSPLLEKVFFDIIKQNADIFFKSAKSSDYFLGKALAIAAIPGVNLIYNLAVGPGSFYKNLQEQGRKFSGMQACALKDISEDEGIKNFPFTENECESISSDLLKSYKLLFMGLYATGILVKENKIAFGSFQEAYGIETPLVQYFVEDLQHQIIKAQISANLLNSMIRDISQDTF
jgi:hypothetical protein